MGQTFFRLHPAVLRTVKSPPMSTVVCKLPGPKMCQEAMNPCHKHRAAWRNEASSLQSQTGLGPPLIGCRTLVFCYLPAVRVKRGRQCEVLSIMPSWQAECINSWGWQCPPSGKPSVVTHKWSWSVSNGLSFSLYVTVCWKLFRILSMQNCPFRNYGLETVGLQFQIRPISGISNSLANWWNNLRSVTWRLNKDFVNLTKRVKSVLIQLFVAGPLCFINHS